QQVPGGLRQPVELVAVEVRRARIRPHRGVVPEDEPRHAARIVTPGEAGDQLGIRALALADDAVVEARERPERGLGKRPPLRAPAVTTPGPGAATRAAMRAAWATETVIAGNPPGAGARPATCCATASTGVPVRLPSTMWTRWPCSRATAASTRVPMPGISSSPSRTRSIARSQHT